MKTEDIIAQAAATLRNGGTLLYPTDTIWGIGCDACNAAAVERLYALKERDRSKSMLILAKGISLDNEVLQGLYEEMAAQADRPTTYIVPAASLMLNGVAASCRLAENLVAADGTIGVRVPRHDFCQHLLTAVGCPVVSTSANLSGQPSPKSYNDIAVDLIRRVDYCVPALERWDSHEARGSRIIKITHQGTLIVRG